MTIDTKRLATDPGYWDECGAPEWAEVYLSHFSPGKGCFAESYDQDSKATLAFGGDRMPFNLAVSCWKDPIRRPKALEVEWDGGFPPIGTECEFSLHLFGARSEWEKCEFLARSDKRGVSLIVTERDYEMVFDSDQPRFRPIHTKEQRQKDDLATLIDDSQMALGSFWTPERAAEVIISAGWKKDV